MASLTQTRNPLTAYRVRVECEYDWKEFQKTLKRLGLTPPKLLTNKSKLKTFEGAQMYEPGEMTFRTRLSYRVMVLAAGQADDCHVLAETLALIDDFDGVRRETGENFSRDGDVVYPHLLKQSWRDTSIRERAERRAREEAAAAAERQRITLLAITTCSDDDLWAELARRGLVATTEAVLVGNC